MPARNSTKSDSIQGADAIVRPTFIWDKVCYSDAMQPTLTTSPYTIFDRDLVLTDGMARNAYTLRVRDMDDRQKPRERLVEHGPGDLSLAELVAIVLGFGTRREEVMTMARRILKEYGDRALMHEANPRRLSEALDIPLAKACQLVACFEIGRRLYATRGGKPVVVRTAAQAYDYLQDMGALQKEQLRALYVNSRYQVIHAETVSVGSLTANIVHPREVFQPAIEYGAVAVIVAHNHPSGSLEPTHADHEATRQLAAAGAILGIELLDHLIISHEGYTSIMKEAS